MTIDPSARRHPTLASDGPFAGPHAPDEALLAICQTCGMCLGACPTYELTRDPDESPRGRIRLIKAVSDGVLALDSPRFVDHTWSCVLCRACETVCPSAVPYQELAIAARAELVRNDLLPPARRPVAWMLRAVFTRPRVLRLVARVLRVLETTGLTALARRSATLALVAPRLATWTKASPHLRGTFATQTGATRPTAPAAAGLRVGLLAGCVMPLAFGEARRAAIRVLERLGAQVSIAPNQACCGALHEHAGELRSAADLARRNIDAWDLGALDVIVSDSSGCAAALQDYGRLLRDDPAYAARARRVSEMARDFSQVAADLAEGHDWGVLAGRVTYQDACQLRHAQKVRREPRDMLRQIAGAAFIEAAEPDLCCGSGGTYALTDPATSTALRERKLDVLLATGAEVIVSTNPGCLMHVQAGLQERGSTVRVLHLAQFLDAALAKPATAAEGPAA